MNKTTKPLKMSLKRVRMMTIVVASSPQRVKVRRKIRKSRCAIPDSACDEQNHKIAQNESKASKNGTIEVSPDQQRVKVRRKIRKSRCAIPDSACDEQNHKTAQNESKASKNDDNCGCVESSTSKSTTQNQEIKMCDPRFCL